jgi:hypothetical protein
MSPRKQLLHPPQLAHLPVLNASIHYSNWFQHAVCTRAIALTWSDLNLRTMEVNVLRSCVRNRIGKTKTESSCRPVPLHPLVLNALLEWRAKSPYSTDADFLFPSVRFKGNRPLSPDSILEKSIRPALARRCKFFLVEGELQNEDDVVHVQAKRITQLSNNGLALSSHDFH